MRYSLEKGIKESYNFFCQADKCDNMLQVSQDFYRNDFMGLTGARAGARKEGWRKRKTGWMCPHHATKKAGK